jgi:site-specific DNA-methyltransferase (adenine-specific)
MKKNIIHLEDCIEGMKKIKSNTADIIILDPPYNIGKDFGNNFTKKDIEEYIKWFLPCLKEAERILKQSGTLFIYGFSEILAHISVNVSINHRWLIWHYTNKTVPSATFWQRSHESIIVAWKDKKERIFNLDDVREPYTDSYLKNAAGKTRKATEGRFSKGNKETTYQAHDNGALPRDVFKISALAGGAGAKERFFYCKDCKDSFFNKEKKEHKDHNTFNHPTQKPYSLTEKLLKSAMNKKNETLLIIPFCGSGSELIVAQDLDIDFISFEINKDYKIMAEKILKKSKKS